MVFAYSRPGIRSALSRYLLGEEVVRRYVLSARPRHRIRVSILDDHPIVGLGMAAFLRHQADFEVVQAETSALRFLETLKESPCDVAIVDFYLPREPSDGVDFIRRLRRQHPDLIIITFSGGKVEDTQYAAYKAGANGYVPKGERLLCVAEMIRKSIGAPRTFHACSQGRLHAFKPPRPDPRLTTAEAEILRNMALGLSVTQISGKLLRSKKTVSTHKRRAMKKLALTNDLALALYLKEKFARSAEMA
ncbi:response regulator transcription factor [Achromobacter aloeverae]